jgi:UDP-2,3-diacylglucosamine pyrophosphatase LpxH
MFHRFIIEFLKEQDIEQLILLGDIVDFWRRSSLGVIMENLEILQELSSLKTEKYYVIGNHDFSFSELVDYPITLDFKFVPELSLKNGDRVFTFIHGYQLEFEKMLPLYEQICEYLCGSGDKWGKKLSDLWNWYEKNFKKKSSQQLFNSLLRREENIFDERIETIGDIKNLRREKFEELIKFVEKNPEDREISKLQQKEQWEAKMEIVLLRKTLQLDLNGVLIFGHTHEPFCKENQANTGSWIKGRKNENSYLIIDEGTMDLKFFN